MSYKRKWYGTQKERKEDEETQPSACVIRAEGDDVLPVNDLHEPRSPMSVDLLHRASLPPIEFPRRPGESSTKCARRMLDILTGCYGD